MDLSLLILAAIVLGYIGIAIYLANLDDLSRSHHKPAVTAAPSFESRDVVLQQRSTILRWLLYGIVAINLVFALLILQFSLLGSSPETIDELRQFDVALPQVDPGAAVTSFVVALASGIFSIRTVVSPATRAWLKNAIMRGGVYDPDSSVHTVAIVLSLTFVSLTFGQLVLTGGISGLAQDVEMGGVSLSALAFQTALMIAVAFLGVGMAIRRTGQASLERLGLRLPTTQDLVWGIGMGLFLYALLLVMGTIWTLIVPLDQIQEQSAAAEQIARSFNTLPLAFLLSFAAAVSEEILFRGAIQPIFGLIPTSILFALLHIQYSLTPATIIIFVVALGLGWLRKRQSTTAAIIAHFVYNFVQLALAILFASALNGSNF